MADKQKPRALSLEEVSERTGMPLAKLQEQQAAKQAQIQSSFRAESASSVSSAKAGFVDTQPSWFDRLKDKASSAFTEAANFADESVTMAKDLGKALENSGTENSLSDQRTQRLLNDAMKP